MSESTPFTSVSDNAAPTVTQISGFVSTVTDLPGSTIFSYEVSKLDPFSASLALDFNFLNQQANETASIVLCPSNPSYGPCDCGCNYPNVVYQGTDLANYSTPDTANCNANSHAKTPTAGNNYYCLDTSATETIAEWYVSAPTSGTGKGPSSQGFVLTLADGTTIAPAGSLFFYSTGNGYLTMEAGSWANDGLGLTPPTEGSLVCTPSRNGVAQNAFCNGIQNVQFIFSELAATTNNPLPINDIQIHYYQNGAPATLDLTPATEWAAGIADPGGPMVFQNAWANGSIQQADWAAPVQRQ